MICRKADHTWWYCLEVTLGSKSFDYQFMATVHWRGQGIYNEGDNRRGEMGIPVLPELSPNWRLNTQWTIYFFGLDYQRNLTLVLTDYMTTFYTNFIDMLNFFIKVQNAMSCYFWTAYTCLPCTLYLSYIVHTVKLPNLEHTT